MRAFDGSIEFQLALRNVTGRALVIADLRPAGMILSGCKVHVVMAGTAGCPCRRCQIPRRLRCSGVLLVAGFASARI